MTAMKRVPLIAVTCFLVGAIVAVVGSRMFGWEPTSGTRRGLLMTNASQIEGLYRQVNPQDSIAVFRYVYSRLPDSVTVYPSENYFYMKFTLAGRPYDCALMLFPNDRKQGLVRFGYIERLEERVRGALLPMRGGWANLDPGNGMHVEKVDRFRYRLTYDDKSVLFTLHVDSTLRPRKILLTSDEEYVGPSFDESGLQFFLLFNRAEKKLYWVLNDEAFVPEEFIPFGSDVVIGVRTGFAFYKDTINKRHILIGVEGFNVMQNNWFDGPFDQMPDNYVEAGLLSVKRYLVAAYGIEENRIDSFGVFVRTPGSRIPVAPYRVYFDTAALRFVDTIRAAGLSGSKFYAAITQQRYDIPPQYRRNAEPGSGRYLGAMRATVAASGQAVERAAARRER